MVAEAKRADSALDQRFASLQEDSKQQMAALRAEHAEATQQAVANQIEKGQIEAGQSKAFLFLADADSVLVLSVW